MANVLLGIVGVVLFIGLALAGASFFGPVMDDAMVEARANGVVQVMSTTAKAVSVRNRELETLTPASSDSSILVSDYLEDRPTNPYNGNPIMMLTMAGGTSGGHARAIVTKLSSRDEAMCRYINKLGTGATELNAVSAIPSRSIGCAVASGAVGAIGSGEYFAFMSIN